MVHDASKMLRLFHSKHLVRHLCYILRGFFSVWDTPADLFMTNLAFNRHLFQFAVFCPAEMMQCVHFSYQIPYLGLCSCEEQDTGVWQLVDPPIPPLTHGPNHSFNWRETLQQEWHSLTCRLTTLEGCAFCCHSCTRTLINIFVLMWLTSGTLTSNFTFTRGIGTINWWMYLFKYVIWLFWMQGILRALVITLNR